MTFNLKKSLKSIGLVGFIGGSIWLVNHINNFENAIREHDIKIKQHTKEIDKLQDKVDARC